jgi:fibro-slime domain-containing protein
MILAFTLLTFFLGVSISADVAPLILQGTLYDFPNADVGGHKDFNSFMCGLSTGMVEDTLSSDRKPKLKDNGNFCVDSKESFDQWYRPVYGVNEAFDYTVVSNWDEDLKCYTFNNHQFFPLDGIGYGNENKGHNYGFTFELHTMFTYSGGEKYQFIGDDDVWVFINGRLAVDLGGVHGATEGRVDLDSLGLTKGETYAFDFFFAERHQSESNMGFSTNMQLFPCGKVDKDGDFIFDVCDACPFGDLDLDLSVDDNKKGKTVPVYISLGNTVRDGVTVKLDWGDGHTEEVYTAIGASKTHTYEKSGEYVISGSVEASGCGSSESTVTVTVGSRIAPTCSRTLAPQ